MAVRTTQSSVLERAKAWDAQQKKDKPVYYIKTTYGSRPVYQDEFNKKVNARREELAAEKMQQRQDEMAEHGITQPGAVAVFNAHKDMEDYKQALQRAGLRAGIEDSLKQVNQTGKLAYNPTEVKLRTGLNQDAQAGLQAKIDNENDIINNQGRKENDPAVITAKKNLKELQDRLTETQRQANEIPKMGTAHWPAPSRMYTREEEEKINHIQSRLEKGKTKNQDVQLVMADWAKQMALGRNYSNITNEKEYVQWLNQAADAGVMTPEEKKNAKKYVYMYNAPDIKNSRAYSQYIQDGIEQGIFDDEDEITMWSTKKLNADLADLIARRDQDQTNRMNNGEINAELYKKMLDRDRLEILATGEIPSVWEGNAPAEEFLDVIRSGKKPADYDKYSDQYDAWMYDFIYGDNAWNREFVNGTEEESDRAYERVEELWNRFENGTISDLADSYNDEIGNLQDKAYTHETNLDRQIKAYQDELNRRETVTKYGGNIQGQEYNPSLLGEDLELRYGDNLFGVNSANGENDMDYMYFYINRVAGTEQDRGDGMIGELTEVQDAENPYAKYSFMDYEQVAKFNELYNSGQKEAARAYLQALDPYLSQMARGRAEELRYNASKGQYGGWYGAATILRQPVAGLMGTVGTVVSLMGNEDAKNPNSNWYKLQKMNDTTRGARAESWGDFFAENFGEEYRETGEWLNGFTYTIADNIMAMAIAKGTGLTFNYNMSSKAAERMIQFVMSSGATASEMVNRLESGMDPTEAAIRAIGKGFIEAITEKYSIEALLKPGVKDMLGDWKKVGVLLAKNTFAEGSEEGASDILSTIWDEMLSGIYGHESDLKQEYNALIANGMSEEEASRQVLNNWMEQLGSDVLAGALSGFVLSGGRVALNSLEQQVTGSKINSQGNETAGKSGVEQLIEAAKGMSADTESRQLAEQLYEKTKKGKKVSNNEAGRLAQNIAYETNEQVGEIAKDTVEQLVADTMKENGATGEQIAATAGIVAQAVVNNKKLTKEQLSTVAQVKQAVEAYRDFMTDEGQMVASMVVNAEPEVQTTKSIQDTVSKLITGESAAIISRKLSKDVIESAKKAKLATEDDIAEAQGKRSKTGTDAIVDNEIVQVTGKSGNSYQILKADGTAATVGATAVQPIDLQIGTLMGFSEKNSNILGEKGFNAITAGIADNRKTAAGRYMEEALKVYMAARTQGEMPTTSINKETAESIWNAAQEENQTESEKRMASGQLEVTPGKGTATFDGTEYGTEEWKKQIKNLSKQQRNQMGAVAEYATRIGLHVNFINDPENRKIFGSEDKETGTITLNIAGKEADMRFGGKVILGGNHHLLVVAAHEFTHWLEQNSTDSYNEMRQFVFNKLRAKGQNVEDLVISKIDAYRAVTKQELTIEDAMAEIVADACDQVLGNEQVVKELQKVNPSLYDKTRSFVKNMVARISEAVAGMESSASYEARLLMDYRDELSRIWLGTMKEAQSREQNAKKAQNKNGVKNSIGQRDVDVSAWKRYQMRDGELYMMDNNDNETKLTGLDREYVEAWWNHDWTRMEEILADKIRENGAIPFKTPNAYTSPSHQWVANAIKTGNTMAIGQAAQEMAQLVPDNAVLVPMPNHHGQTTDDTDTVVLAEAISKITGRPVIRALAGVERESRKTDKAKPKSQQMKAADLGFRQVAEIPEGTVPYFVDNVIASGLTAEAAHRALGNNGVTLAYAKSTRSANDGLKRANVTFYDTSKQYGSYLIPLSERIDMSRKGYAGTKFSVQQLDDAYMEAIESGDIGTAEALNKEAARRAGFDTSEIAYHGTNSFGFTEFNLDDMQGQIFVAYNPDMARTYTENSAVKTISEAPETLAADVSRMKPQELVNYAKKLVKKYDQRVYSYDVKDIRYLEDRNMYAIDVGGYSFRVTKGELMREVNKALMDKGGLYQFYTRPGKQLVVDAEGNFWNEIPFDLYGTKVGGTIDEETYEETDTEWDENYDPNAPHGWIASTRDIARWAEAHGYDSVRINNVADDGMQNADVKRPAMDFDEDFAGFMKGDIGIFFNPNDVKSADPITYEDDGSIIPPSERYSSESNDMRFSVQQQDQSYMEAVNDGNMQKAQAMVDEAAEEALANSKIRTKNGKLLKVYHGTSNMFTVFDTSVSGGTNGTAEGYGIYLSDNQEITEKYGNRQIAAYLDMERPARDDRKTIRKPELVRMIKATCEAQAKQIAAEEEYDDYREVILDTWISNYVNTRDYPGISAAYAAAADVVLRYNNNDADIVREVMAGMAIRDYERAMEFYRTILTPTTGIDGFWMHWTSASDNSKSNVFLALDSSQIKSADPVTYDDDGNAIPLSERFNKENPDIRYSIDQGDMNVQVWLQGLTEGSLSTAQEKTMLRQYQDLKKGLDVMRGLNEERRRKLEKLLAKPNPSAYDRKQIRDLQAVIQAKQREIDRQEEKLAKVTSEKGFARLMYTQAKIMEDLVNGRTADDVRHTVDAISRELEAVKKEMAERSEQLKTLAEKEAVIRIRQQLNSAGLKRIAAKLKTDLNSNLSNTEIENRLALMALKMKEGKVDSDEVTELADMLIGKMNPAYDSYVLETLRGRTITLNKNQLAELKGQNRTVREIQQELAGTGIRIRTTGGNTLDQNWDELCDLLPQLNREASDADMLDNLMDLVASERRAARAEGANNDQVAAMVVTAAADLIPEIVTDKKSMQLIRETLKYIAEMSRQAGETAKAMEELNSLMDRLQTKGRQAKSTLGTLENKIHDAIEYNNKLTEQSEAATWKEERRKLINSLNSEHAQAMIAQQQEFRERIEKDRKARNTQAENAALRRRINTNITRVRALLMRESAQKNIPEHMKPLARHMLEKIVNNDLVGRKISGISREDLQETKRVLDAWKAQDGEYNPDSLKGLDDAVQDALYNAVEDLISGIEYYNESAKGHSLQENLDRYNGALTEISNAVSTITSIINAERTISLGDRRVLLDDMAYKVQESTGGRRARELTGKAGLAIANLRKAVVSGNLTPEYFFRTLKNAGLDDLWEEYHRAENRNGLELLKAQTRLDEIAKKYGYKNWDMDKRLTVKLDSGDVSMTLGQIMSLYATWKREHTLGPAMSNHLQMGGFYVEENDPRKGFLGRRVVDLKAHRVNEQDMQLVQSLMTDEQQQFVDEIVSYMSNEMSELGNEASMKAYGIKMYKESYYFPFKMWDGIKARASNDSGSAAAANERAFHPSFSKTRLHGANNAVMIGDFMTTAADHIVGMINYATMGLANENLQRVLNKQVPEGDRLDTMTKRTIRTVLQEAYGKEATDYLAKLQEQLNGGVSRIDRTIYDRALTLFRKNAVAGSMSVALQQPLSYIRAAMMINPKYLAGALSPVYWRGSFKEMMAHSGVAVIKKMGRFDMGFGAGAREFISPEGKEGRVRQAWDAVTEKATILPELMDQMTWTRMWSAVKMEQHALHPEMDIHSDAFLDMVGERFNDVMRKTQVYDSTLTKSQNMRSQNPFVKSITSFMAEPTLTLNVLADAARNAGEKGGKVRLAKALATFALSAAAQAAVKAIMSSGRSPDDKKTWYENFEYRFWTNLIQEADVANLVPGYNDLIMLLKNGKLDDDALGAIGKIFTAFEKMTQVASPDKINDYRAWEDGPAQIIQLFSQLPAKNIMRDLRAMYNWFIGKPYAQRENSAAVLKLQRDAAAMTADNLLGVIVAKLGEAGYKTTNKAYYGRMFDAMQRGDQEAADEIREYLQLTKNVKDEAIESGLRSQAKDNLAPAESSQWMIDNDLMDSTGTITTQYKKGDITADEAKKLYKAADPKLSDDDIWWKIDQADYYKETGETKTGYYYRLGPALETNRSEQINAVIKDLLKHGRTKEQVKTQINTELKQKYLEADSSGRVRIRDEMQKAYRAAGYTVDDANKQIEKWKKDAEKKK